MSKIIAIGKALPLHRHRQMDILQFMLQAYQPEAGDRRKIGLLYERSGIDYRYSVIPDFSGKPEDRDFFPASNDLEPFPRLEQRLQLYNRHAAELSIRAIQNCITGEITPGEITGLITVSCTGMSAPGLDISIMQQMDLSPSIQRSSVNFMGCYAAIHALKMANNICEADPSARVVVVCTELCTLHFQKDCEMDSIASGLLFGDGAAAVLVTGEEFKARGIRISSFYSEVALKGQKDMAWDISGKGFLMRLSAYIPELLKAAITPLLHNALRAGNHHRDSITRWAIHPGGKKIIETITRELGLEKEDVQSSYDVLREYGNMSSPTILFVLENILQKTAGKEEKIFVAAFGPGLTMETMILEQ